MGGEDEAPGGPQLVEGVHHARQLLLGAGHGPVILVPGVQGQVGDAPLDLEEDGVQGQGELQAGEGIALMEACAARDHRVAEEQVGGRAIAGGHPGQQLGEVLLDLGQHRLPVHQIIGVYEVSLKKVELPLLLHEVPAAAPKSWSLT